MLMVMLSFWKMLKLSRRSSLATRRSGSESYARTDT